VRSRLIAQKLKRGKKTISLYLFTYRTYRGNVVDLYGRRWNVELDVHCLKQTILQYVTANSVHMAEKELLVAVSAYNLCALSWCWRAAGQSRATVPQFYLCPPSSRCRLAQPDILQNRGRTRESIRKNPFPHPLTGQN